MRPTHEVAPALLLRAMAALAVVALPAALAPPGRPIPLELLAPFLVLGLFTRTAALIAVLGFLGSVTYNFFNIFHDPTAMLRQGLLLAVLGLTRFVFLDAGHAPGVDPLARWLRRKPRLPPPAGSKAAARRAWWERQRAWQSALLEKWRVLALSLIVASLLMLDGAVLLARGSPWEQGLGVAWMAVGTALAFGLLTPWAALAGALLLPFGSWVTGDALWVAAALGSLAVAFTHGRRPGADQWLAEHGLIGGLRREVVVRPR